MTLAVSTSFIKYLCYIYAVIHLTVSGSASEDEGGSDSETGDASSTTTSAADASLSKGYEYLLGKSICLAILLMMPLGHALHSFTDKRS